LFFLFILNSKRSQIKGDFLWILNNFTIIVESKFNISAASKIIHVSQPALSQMIATFEKEQKVSLFERAHGRLQGLSLAGELLYTYAKEITEKHNQLMEEIQSQSNQLRGHINVWYASNKSNPPVNATTPAANGATHIIEKPK